MSVLVNVNNSSLSKLALKSYILHNIRSSSDDEDIKLELLMENENISTPEYTDPKPNPYLIQIKINQMLISLN